MLTAGPETDLAVAKACGFDACIREYEEIFGCWRLGPGSDPPEGMATLFRPSTDLNVAFFATDHAKLWLAAGDACCHLTFNHLAPPDEAWEFGAEGENPIVAESTPALALCAAILKVDEILKAKAAAKEAETSKEPTDAQ